MHEKCCFVSLTYSPENLPVSDESGKVGRGVLCLSDLQKFVKRLRKKFSGRQIRFYACGEYGPTGTHIPHYHLILFGVDAEELDHDWFVYQGKSGPLRKNFVRNSLLYELWNKFGLVHVGDASVHSIAYCAGYVTHKLTKKNDGYTPEFHVMSRRPGLGVEALADIARHLCKVSENNLDVGDARQIYAQGNLWPTGRYLLSKLRHVSNVSASDEQFIADLCSAQSSAQQQGFDLVSYLVSKNDQKRLNLERKQQLFHSRSKL